MHVYYNLCVCVCVWEKEVVSYWMFVIVHLAAGLQRTNFLNVVVEEKRGGVEFPLFMFGKLKSPQY